MQIIDGYVGTPNIYADVIGEHNISMYGSGDYVLNVGECLGYELISNNEIRIKDGMFITQGRRGYIKKGTTEVCRIDNGAQSGKRNDLIVIEYAKDLSTQVESHTIRVLKGIPGAEASDPEITTGNIPDGAILHQMPLYRVKIEGLSVAAVEQMFEFGSVAAETVNPMLATEEGFAADAYQTKLQLEEQNKNMGGLRFGVDASGNYGYIKDGADTVTPFKKGYEDTPGTATAKMLTKGYTAWVNGKLITGERIAPVTKLSGTFDLWIPYTEWVTEHIVTFSTPFDNTPTVTYAMTSTGGQTSTDDIEIKSVSKTAIKFATKGKNWKYCTITVQWVAEA